MFLANEWKSQGDVTSAVKNFYEQTPFPNYEDIDSSASLREKAEQGIFAKQLDAQIPTGAIILEAGCGTGQLSNFLGLTAGRTVFGTDMCLNSLKLGEEFRRANEIENVGFFQMNLFRPIFKPESFHLVVSNGVLHHTCDPYGGFRSILKLVKRGGFIIIGLYHYYGRIPTDIRRTIFNGTGNRLKFLDPRLRKNNIGDLRKHTWFMDQYKNPHESKHTINEVMRWFDENGVEFVNSIPSLDGANKKGLFETRSKSSLFGRFLTDVGMLFRGTQEGGFFIMIGKKSKL